MKFICKDCGQTFELKDKVTKYDLMNVGFCEFEAFKLLRERDIAAYYKDHHEDSKIRTAYFSKFLFLELNIFDKVGYNFVERYQIFDDYSIPDKCPNCQYKKHK